MWSSDSESDNENARAVYRYRERINFVILTDGEFLERFRLNREQCETLLQDIGPAIANQTIRWYGLSPLQKLLIALHWFGNGGQYHGVCDMHGVSKMTVCRCVHEVVASVNEIKFDALIRWPDNTGNVVERFHNLAGFPEVCGIVDGTLINIDAPTNNEPTYVDRHGKHSINCMAVCGPDLKFYYISANWPGSVHDARVLRNSSLFRRMENGWRPHANAIILGDSAYPLREWLIPPTYDDPMNPAQTAFNRAHKRTRRIIENALGVLKEKFPCLNYLRVDPVFAANIFKCCATLCNITKNNEDDVELNGYDDEVDENNPRDNEPPPITGRARVQQLIDYFRIN